MAMASWHAGQRRFEWLLDSPAGEEAPFVEPSFFLDLASAIELVCFAAVRIGAAGVVQGTLETGVTVFLATRT
jgi:predicted nicotinamide N-methyase